MKAKLWIGMGMTAAALMITAGIWWQRTDKPAWSAGNTPKTNQMRLSESELSSVEDVKWLAANDVSGQAGLLALVNRTYAWQGGEDRLVSIYENKNDSYYVRDKTVRVDERMMQPLNQMLDDFYKETGNHTINVVAGYRTADDQRSIYENSVRENGEAHTARYVAQPGQSEHHTGLAVDFSLFFNEYVSGDFTGEGDTKWILENAGRYGFVQRYPAGREEVTGIAEEPWHFRYVGPVHAAIMQQRDYCMEEYIPYLKTFQYGKKHLQVSSNGTAVEIYYTEGEQIPVPQDADYMLSADNTGGYIVTVTCS